MKGCEAVGAWPHWNQAGDLGRPPEADGSDQTHVPGQQLASHREVRCCTATIRYAPAYVVDTGHAALRSLCRVHLLRNLLSHVPIGEAFSEGVAGKGMVAAAMKAVFVIQDT